jgi:hypothetical protein
MRAEAIQLGFREIRWKISRPGIFRMLQGGTQTRNMRVYFDTLEDNLLYRRPALLDLSSYFLSTKRMAAWVLYVMTLEEIRDVVRLDNAASSPDSGYVLKVHTPPLACVYPS